MLLVPDGSNQPVEFGAIAIHLRYFDSATHAAILECRKPLGAILRDHKVKYSTKLSGFLRFDKAPDIRQALHVRNDEPMFGRRNVLISPSGDVLAEVIEVLPPENR